jgi:hypothetical protein
MWNESRVYKFFNYGPISPEETSEPADVVVLFVWTQACLHWEGKVIWDKEGVMRHDGCKAVIGLCPLVTVHPMQRLHSQQWNNCLKQCFLCCLCWDYVTRTYIQVNRLTLLKMQLQLLQNKVLCPTECVPRLTLIPDFHMVFNFPYVYDYISTLCWQKQRSYKLVRMTMFAAQCALKPDTEKYGGIVA